MVPWAWSPSERERWRCRVPTVVGPLPLASLRLADAARPCPRRRPVLVGCGWSRYCTHAAHARLDAGLRRGCDCIARSMWCSPRPSSYLLCLVLKLEPCRHDESTAGCSGDETLPCPVLPASQHRRSRLGPAACCYERRAKPPGLVTCVHELALPPPTGAPL